jgi:hypothetical protein
MNIGCQTSSKCAAQSATARLDREFAAQTVGGWFDLARTKIQTAAIFQVPVGYEDDAGFHCGIQRLEPVLPMVSYSNDEFGKINRF